MRDLIEGVGLISGIETQPGSAEGAVVQRASFTQAAAFSQTDRRI